MANTFALILACATLVTGIIWCLERFRWAPARRAKLASLKVQGAEADQIAKPANWVETLASLFPVLALVFVVRSFIYEPFQIPSGSMMPTLLIGDFILVEKYAYGIKDPITLSTLIPTGKPKRGDIVVFKYPNDPRLDYIKRAIGLPGDRVVYDKFSKQVTVYPSCGKQPCDSSLSVTYDMPKASEFVQTFNNMGTGGETSGGFFSTPLDQTIPDGLRLLELTEHLGDVNHRILILPQAQDQDQNYAPQPVRGEWIVPEGHYFMMGDNRDNSSDGRYWGFVPERNLVGKATFIWMSFEKQEGQWPTGVRLSRIGRIQ